MSVFLHFNPLNLIRSPPPRDILIPLCPPNQSQPDLVHCDAEKSNQTQHQRGWGNRCTVLSTLLWTSFGSARCIFHPHKWSLAIIATLPSWLRPIRTVGPLSFLPPKLSQSSPLLDLPPRHPLCGRLKRFASTHNKHDHCATHPHTPYESSRHMPWLNKPSQPRPSSGTGVGC